MAEVEVGVRVGGFVLLEAEGSSFLGYGTSELDPA